MPESILLGPSSSEDAEEDGSDSRKGGDEGSSVEGIQYFSIGVWPRWTHTGELVWGASVGRNAKLLGTSAKSSEPSLF